MPGHPENAWAGKKSRLETGSIKKGTAEFRRALGVR